MKLPFVMIMALFTCVITINAQLDVLEMGEFINNEQKKWRIPNLAIGITLGDSIIFQQVSGKSQNKGNFLIGSVSKSFIALAVMQLVEKGKIDLDAPVDSYLPWFTIAGENSSSEISVRHLLNHTSGIPKSAGFFLPKSDKKEKRIKEYQKYLKKLKLEETPGTKHTYSNLNYAMLGELIEQVNGKPYGDYVRKHIFNPLHMDASFADFTKAAEYGFMEGYQYYFGFPFASKTKYNNNLVPAGGIASNTGDMLKYLQCMLRKGHLSNGSTLIDSSLLSVMHTPVDQRYGMGWSIGPWNGLQSIRHSGLNSNYSCSINLLPEQNYGIVVLTNVNSFTASKNIMDGIIRRLNNQDKIDLPPKENYLRYGLLALVVWSILEFLLRLKKWKMTGYAKSFKNHKKVWTVFISGIFLSLIWLFVIPFLAKLPLSKMPVLQPDLGYGLLLSVAIGILSAAVKTFIESYKIHRTEK